MKLYIDQRFAHVTPERFISVYFSEAFNEAVAPVSGLRSRRLVEETVGADGMRHRRVRMEPAVTLPAPIEKVVDGLAGHGGAAIQYEEVSTWDPGRRELAFRIDSRANERVRFEGIIRIVADGGDGVRRIIDASIDIKAPLGLGGIIERFVEAETRKGYDKIGAFLQRWLDEGR